MAKAYDRMSWVFIIRVLRCFGFGERFIDMVWRLLSNVLFSMLVNGVPYGLFKSSRGLRQGDPLSPVLFIIGAEVLSRGLNLLYSQSNFVGYKVPRYCPTISHLAFADDIIIFANGSTSSLKKIMRVLELYQKASGVMPKSIFHMIERVCANFLWGTTEESRRFHWVRWRDLCFPPEEGGVGFWSIDDTYRVFSCKLWKTFRQNLSLWAMFMRAKDSHDTHPCQVALRSPSSATWRRMLDVRGFAELFILWRPYSGFCHFWYDNWTGSGELYLRADVQDHLSFHDFIVCETWDSRLLSHVFPPNLVQAMVGMPIPCISSVHRMVWTASSSGSFSLSSALQEVRQAKPSSFMFSQASRLLMFKLNIDGCSKGNPGLSGGGGILRDGSGKFIFAFASCFDVTTSLQGEAKALALGLSFCAQRNFLQQLVVESDSLVLLKILRNDYQCLWTISYEIE
ncbi:uncharacterized protein [Coffea arabica]|uniref:Reverse transcriptase domain-containing protein n=1 Tax=Coffea arabica TaxID=13443 RepID=A0ABM4VH88_COFAR